MTFRWPWVSRALIEAEQRRAESVQQLLEQRTADLRADLVAERARSAKLTRIVIRLKRDGAVLLPAKAIAAVRREPSPIEKAIDSNKRARKNPALRSYLVSWADEQVALGRDPELVAEECLTWSKATHEEEEEEPAFS